MTTTTVLVPTWRRPEDLRRCLAALSAQTVVPGEILVVARSDDAETGSVLASLAAEGPIRTTAVPVDAPGVVASINAGLDAATGDVVLITDDDAVPHPDWLARIVRTFAERPGAGGVGGRDWVRHEGRLVDGRAERVGKLRWFGRLVGDHHLGTGGPREVDVLKGVNMAFRRRALDGVRISTALRGRGAQAHWEVDLCLAVRRRGWTLIYDPEIAVDHFPAPRHDAPRRRLLTPAALADEVFNQTYGLLRGLPWWRKPIVFGYGLVVGTTQAPGPVCALVETLRGRRVGALTWTATRARAGALTAYGRRRAAR